MFNQLYRTAITNYTWRMLKCLLISWFVTVNHDKLIISKYFKISEICFVLTLVKSNCYIFNISFNKQHCCSHISNLFSQNFQNLVINKKLNSIWNHFLNVMKHSFQTYNNSLLLSHAKERNNEYLPNTQCLYLIQSLYQFFFSLMFQNQIWHGPFEKNDVYLVKIVTEDDTIDT